MAKLVVLMNHVLTEDQLEDARKNLKIDRIVYSEEAIKKKWMGINPESENIAVQLDKVVNWLTNISDAGDYILVQGEFGATYFVVDFCFASGRVPVYATSKRVYEEFKLQDGSIERKHIFKHVRFRKYIRWKDFFACSKVNVG